MLLLRTFRISPFFFPSFIGVQLIDIIVLVLGV